MSYGSLRAEKKDGEASDVLFPLLFAFDVKEAGLLRPRPYRRCACDTPTYQVIVGDLLYTPLGKSSWSVPKFQWRIQKSCCLFLYGVFNSLVVSLLEHCQQKSLLPSFMCAGSHLPNRLVTLSIRPHSASNLFVFHRLTREEQSIQDSSMRTLSRVEF